MTVGYVPHPTRPRSGRLHRTTECWAVDAASRGLATQGFSTPRLQPVPLTQARGRWKDCFFCWSYQDRLLSELPDHRLSESPAPLLESLDDPVKPQAALPDVTGDPGALARAAGVGDGGALLRARQAVQAVLDAEEALRQAVCARDEAIRDAAEANPSCGHPALARLLGDGWTPGRIKTIVRRSRSGSA